jgi:hypothetical protein
MFAWWGWVFVLALVLLLKAKAEEIERQEFNIFMGKINRRKIHNFVEGSSSFKRKGGVRWGSR